MVRTNDGRVYSCGRKDGCVCDVVVGEDAHGSLDGPAQGKHDRGRAAAHAVQ